MTMSSDTVAFKAVATLKLRELKKTGLTVENVEDFLRWAVGQMQSINQSILELTCALNDAFLDARIKLRDAPWLNTSRNTVSYAEVELVDFPKPIAVDLR